MPRRYINNVIWAIEPCRGVLARAFRHGQSLLIAATNEKGGFKSQPYLRNIVPATSHQECKLDKVKTV